MMCIDHKPPETRESAIEIAADLVLSINGEHRPIACEAARKLKEMHDAATEQEQSFDLRWNADMRAIKKWQETTGRTLTWPDHADLVVYIQGRLEAAERVIDAAREQGTIPVGDELSDFEAAGLNTALHIAHYDKEFGNPEAAPAEQP